MAEYGRHQRSAAINDQIGRWSGSIGLAVALGMAYFLAARLSLGLLLEPDGVAVFWPAAGISSRLLIALGPHARWPVALGVMAATIPANLMGDRNLPAAIAFALCNAAEALIVAGLIHRYFGPSFNLDQLRKVLGLLGAAIAGTAISGIGGAVAYKLFHSPAAPMLISWWHWFASDAVGILAVAPLFIGLAAAVRRPPVRGEIIEPFAALGALAAITVILIALPQGTWETVVPIALLVPIVLWIAARFRPVFSAASGFIVSLTVIWTTIYGIGPFGGPGLPIEVRFLQAQTFVVGVMLLALVLAAMFAEHRRAEARLVRSNMMLEEERDKQLLNAQAVAAAIAHEIKQPLSAILLNGTAAQRLLQQDPPKLEEAQSALSDLVGDSWRMDQIIENVRQLFGKGESDKKPIDLNKAALAALQLVREELRNHSVTTTLELSSELPTVAGHHVQLEEVVANLVRNANEAMEAVEPARRALIVRTRFNNSDKTVILEVEDSGPGIDPERLRSIFDAFVTTKVHGTGLGLAICRMIAESHGGQLTASSDGRSGARFQVVLPIESTGKAPARPIE